MGMRHAVLSRDGRRLAYSRGQQVANLWRVPIRKDRQDAPGWAEAEQITFDQALFEMIDVSPDGSRLALDSDRSGNLDLWLVPVEGGELQLLTNHPSSDWSPAFSPDGATIAFYSNRRGNRDLWLMPSAGGTARPLSPHSGGDWTPDWSPDGRTIAFHSHRSGNLDVWTIRPDGTELRQVTTDGADDEHPRWSPDGNWLSFASLRDGESRLWIVPVQGGAPRRVSDLPIHYHRWSRDGARIYFPHAGDIWSVSIDGEARQETSLDSRPGDVGDHTLATDGRFLYYGWEQDLGDLWVMDVVYD
jgi:Tol biopolymer transport system component